jgi:hypothetical protein
MPYVRNIKLIEPKAKPGKNWHGGTERPAARPLQLFRKGRDAGHIQRRTTIQYQMLLSFSGFSSWSILPGLHPTFQRRGPCGFFRKGRDASHVRWRTTGRFSHKQT